MLSRSQMTAARNARGRVLPLPTWRVGRPSTYTRSFTRSPQIENTSHRFQWINPAWSTSKEPLVNAFDLAVFECIKVPVLSERLMKAGATVLAVWVGRS